MWADRFPLKKRGWTSKEVCHAVVAHIVDRNFFWGLALPSWIAQERTGDHRPLNLARALVDASHANVAHVPLDREIAHEAVTAVHLQRAIANPIRRFGCEELGNRGLAGERLTFELS